MPAINETLGQYSELFMLLAAGTYTIAFLAFLWDLAKSSKTLQAVDLKAAASSTTAPRKRSLCASSSTPNTARRMTSSVIACVTSSMSNDFPRTSFAASFRAMSTIVFPYARSIMRTKRHQRGLQRHGSKKRKAG